MFRISSCERFEFCSSSGDGDKGAGALERVAGFVYTWRVFLSEQIRGGAGAYRQKTKHDSYPYHDLAARL